MNKSNDSTNTIKGVQLKVSDLFILSLSTAFDAAGSFYFFPFPFTIVT